MQVQTKILALVACEGREETATKPDYECSRSTLIHQRGSALASFLERRFKATKLFRAEFGEHFLHLPGMLSKGGNNKILSARGECDDTNTPVFRALDPGYQTLRGSIQE